MIPLNKRIDLFVFLGELFRDVYSGRSSKYVNHYKELENSLPDISKTNPWFTSESIYQVLNTWGKTLYRDNIEKWTNNYELLSEEKHTKEVMVIMAGNIPLVGFHDFLCTIISGNIFYGKLSSKDNILFPLILDWILKYDSSWSSYILLSLEPLKSPEIIISTGSNNTSRLIKQRYVGKSMIIRHNRSSIGILTGNENDEELKALSQDILMYYGLGCRNISQLFIPEGFDMRRLTDKIEKHQINIPEPFCNNIQYQKAKSSLRGVNILHTSKLLLINDLGLNSPLGTIYYTTYKDKAEIKNFRKAYKNEIQCVVGDSTFFEDVIPFGQSQEPGLGDYADGLDTMEFLLNI